MRKDKPAIEASPESEKPFRPYRTVLFIDYVRNAGNLVSRDELADAFNAIAREREMHIDINYGGRRESHDYRRRSRFLPEKPFTEPSLSADFRAINRTFVICGIPLENLFERPEAYVGARVYRQPPKKMDKGYSRDSLAFAEAALDILKRELFMPDLSS